MGDRLEQLSGALGDVTEAMHRIVDRETPAAMASMLLDSMVDEHGRRLKIEMRKSDGFFNATLMCQSADKRWGNYNDSNIARTYQRRLADITGIPVESLVVSNPGRNGGTWVHRKVALHLAQWISPDFAIWMADLVERYVRGNITTEESRAAATLAGGSTPPACSPGVLANIQQMIRSGVDEALQDNIRRRNVKPLQAAASMREEKAKELRSVVTQAVKDYRDKSSRVTPSITDAVSLLGGRNMGDFIDHMEELFQPGMVWSNWGTGKYNWHFGHVLPLIKFDLDDPGERAEAMAMKNYKPQWGQENLEQGDRLPDGSLGRNKRKRPAANGGEVGAQQRGRSLLELGKPVEWYMEGVQEWLMAYMSKNGGPEPSWQSELVGCTVKAFANTIQKKVGMRLWSELDKTWTLDVDRVVGTDTSKYLELTDAFRHARWMAFNKAPPRPEPSPEPTMNPALCFLDH